MRLTCLLLLAGFTAHGQSDDVPVFSSRTQLVVRAVSVKDRQGSPIEGLSAKDFTLTEDGRPQTISICEFQKLTDNPDTAPGKADSPAATSTYRDHRLLAIYFDMTAMSVSDQLRAFTAVKKFVTTQMSPIDLLEILTFSGGAVKVEREFTNNREVLLQTIRDLITGQGLGFAGSANDDSTSDTGLAFGQDDGEFNIFNTDRQLAALETAVKLLGQTREKKQLLYFASGLRLNGLSNQAQLQATINSAIRAGVSMWPIDSRGLTAQAPLGDATAGSPGSVAIYSGASAQAFTRNFDASQDTLFTLASDTGGKALLNFNDLSAGIVAAQQSVSSYYILGYYTTNQALDGRFRHIRISLTNSTAAKLDYNPGYYAAKAFAKFTSADKERQLEDALMLPDPVTDLTIALEVNYFRLNRAEYFIPLAVKIPGKELAIAKRGGAEHTLIDFIGEVKDEFGSTITNLRDKVDIKLTGQTIAELSRRPIEYDAGFTLLPGHYIIKFLARDDETGRIGTFQSKFVVPNLEKEEKRVPISSVVLSSQLIDSSNSSYGKDALYRSKKGTGEAANPLLEGTRKLMPSVTRVFPKSRPFYVYLQAYETGGQIARPLASYVALYRGRSKVFETPALAVTITESSSKARPIKFDLSLSGLPEGKYDCHVTVLDPTSRKAAFWQAPVLLVQ